MSMRADSFYTSSSKTVRNIGGAGLPLNLLPDGNDKTPKALWASVPGVITFVQDDGTTATDFPILAGPNPVRPASLTASTFSANELWAMY